MSFSRLVAKFPRLSGDENFQVISNPTDRYNCIAWAASENERFWWPAPSGKAYWPTGDRTASLDAFIKAFSTLGYAPCNLDGGFRDQVEKVAIYVEGNEVKHMSRQISDKVWTSKCGGSYDIEHSFDTLDGSIYGNVALILSRPKS